MRPFTKAYPKELLPVGEKAVIGHAIEDLKEAGITEICVVVGWKQHAILDYLGSGERLGVQLTYAVQDERDGLASAVEAGSHVIGEEDFAVVLGDNYVDNSRDMRRLAEKHRSEELDATIGAFRPEDVTSYGVLDLEDEELKGMVEKPSNKEAPSGLAIAGMYVFSAEIFDAIRKTDKGTGGEYQLTDAIENLRKQGNSVDYLELEGERIDVGNVKRLRKANSELDLRQ